MAADALAHAADDATASGRSRGVQSLDRAFDLLDQIALAETPANLSDLALACGLPAPTVHRLLGTLAARGLVRHHESRRYSLGAELTRLGDRARRDQPAIVRTCVRDLAAQIGETAFLAVFEGEELVYVVSVPSRHGLRAAERHGRHAPDSDDALGVLLLSRLSDAAVRGVLDQVAPARAKAAGKLRRFLEDLAVVREQGFATIDSLREPGLCSIAVPLLHPTDSLALAIAGPVARLPAEKITAAVAHMQDASERLSARLHE